MSEEESKVPIAYSIKIKLQEGINTTFQIIKKKIIDFWTKSKLYLKKYYKNYVYVQIKEPPKSFAFEKTFYGLYIIFLFYSFVLILGINDPNNLMFKIFMFGYPFAVANAILLFFLTISLMLNYDKIRIFIFEENTRLKQPLIFGLIILGYFILFIIISTNVNFISFYLALSMIWLILISTRYYTLSRKISTKIEARFISRYSTSRYYLALLAPVFILVVLVIISLTYRSFLVFVALDFFATKDPEGAVQVYNIEMRVIMPLIYFSLIMTIVFIVLEFFATRRKAETRRSGCFDNFTFAFIVLFIFFFQIFQVTLYLLLRPETISTLRNTVGEGSSTLSYLFLFEYGLSMFFLYRILMKLGKTFGWRVLFFKTDGLILFFLSCIFAQTLTAYTLSSQISNQEITTIGTILLANRFVISILMIIFLGLTLLVYYMKPHETSMFIRLQKETVKDEERNLDIIYTLLKNEYIRRGEPYPIEILERELVKTTKLSKAVLYSLIKRIENQKVDIKVTKTRDTEGETVHILDFLSVTEQFEKKEIAEKKAKQFLSRKLIEAVSMKGRKEMKITKPLDKGKASDQLLASLSSTYNKEEEIKETNALKGKKGVSFVAKEIPIPLKEQILEILKKEYLYRIENTDNYIECYYPISEIVNQLSSITRITVGDIYPILESISKSDLELNLISNPEEPADKKIKFFPIADDNLNRALSNFRPKEYSEIRIRVIKNMIPLLKQKTTNAGLASLKRKIPSQNENQKAWRDIVEFLYHNYPSYTKEIMDFLDKSKFLKLTASLKKIKPKKTT